MRTLLLSSLMGLIALSAPAQFEAWLGEARRFLEENPDHPGCEGLRHLVTAVEEFNYQACLWHRSTLDTIIQEGWSTAHPEIVELLRTHGPTLRETIAAADSESIAFPPLFDFESPRPDFSPRPNFLAFQTMFKVVLADARRLEAVGEPGRAAQRAIRTARLADHLLAEDVTLVQHLIGVAGMGMSLRVLESVLRHPDLSEDELRGIGSALHQIDRGHLGVVLGLHAEARASLELARLLRDDPAQWARLTMGQDPGPSATQRMGEGLSDFAAFEAEHSHVWESLIANSERPAWERERFDESWMQRQTTNLCVRLTIPNFNEVVTRNEVAIAHLRICQALCALRLEEEETLAELIDPFTGEPLRMSEDRIWSLGPDQTDQGGSVTYDPTNGTFSGGEIVARR